MCNAKGIGENQLICHRPLQNFNAMEFDREKRRFRLPKHRAPVKNDFDVSQHHHSALAIRLCLREFCLAFLDNCYNILMPRARVLFLFSLTYMYVGSKIELWTDSDSTRRAVKFSLETTK